MANLPYKARELVWMGDSKDELSGFPNDIKRMFGFALRQVQNGKMPEIAKPLKGYPGVFELRAKDADNAYRTVYALKVGESVYVLDAFIKKSKRGKKLPKEVRERITMKAVKSSGNVFSDIGFGTVEAEELAVKADLITLLVRAMRLRKLSQKKAADICETDQPTLSKIINGKLDSITIDQLAKWSVRLGSKVRINVSLPKATAHVHKGEMRVSSD